MTEPALATAPARRDGHSCQAAVGPHSTDPRFPKKYLDDPWCWSEGLGFHRASAPGRERFLLLGKDVRQVSERRISAVQSVLLGAGAGTSRFPDAKAVLGETLAQVLQTARPGYYRGDPQVWARYGQAARGQQWLDHDPAARRALARNLIAAIPGVDPDAPLPHDRPGLIAAVFDLYVQSTDRPLSCETDRLLTVLTDSLPRR
ncbi:MAG TPA: hypothetical protein VF885_10000 [Arthrobacter sp.]